MRKRQSWRQREGLLQPPKLKAELKPRPAPPRPARFNECRCLRGPRASKPLKSSNYSNIFRFCLFWRPLKPLKPAEFRRALSSAEFRDSGGPFPNLHSSFQHPATLPPPPETPQKMHSTE